MTTILENRLKKLEAKSPDALPIWDRIILEGEHPTPEEQAKIDAFKALGHSVIIRRII